MRPQNKHEGRKVGRQKRREGGRERRRKEGREGKEWCEGKREEERKGEPKACS
jgi:hypothetical protein